MRHIVVALTLATLATSSFAASPRREMFVKQVKCTVSTTLQAPQVSIEPSPADVAKAADSCVTSEDMAAGYTGYTKYSDRDAETLRKELDERKGFITKAALARLETCRKRGIPQDQMAQRCVTVKPLQ
jgi:hypothetical protein